MTYFSQGGVVYCKLSSHIYRYFFVCRFYHCSVLQSAMYQLQLTCIGMNKCRSWHIFILQGWVCLGLGWICVDSFFFDLTSSCTVSKIHILISLKKLSPSLPHAPLGVSSPAVRHTSAAGPKQWRQMKFFFFFCFNKQKITFKNLSSNLSLQRQWSGYSTDITVDCFHGIIKHFLGVKSCPKRPSHLHCIVFATVSNLDRTHQNLHK